MNFPSDKPSMVRTLRDYQPLLSQVRQILVQDVDFKVRGSLRKIMQEPRLVVVLNHSTPISWIPPICVLTEKICRAGGGRRVPMGVLDKFFFKHPYLRVLAEFITQSSQPATFDELLEKFLEDQPRDVVIFPEGAFSFFGDLNQIQPFRSPRFVELAVRAKAPILLAIHSGTEHWNFPFPVPQDLAGMVQMVSPFFGQKLAEEGTINLPLRLGKVNRFRMRLELYHPTLREEDLAQDLAERRLQLDSESQLIRQRMQQIFSDLSEQDT